VSETDIQSWHSPEFAGQWSAEDVIAEMLELPRRMSVAIVEDAALDVAHVIDLGAGQGPYLERFLQAFPAASGTWVDSSEAMLELAREQLAPYGDRVSFVVHDVEDLAGAQIEPAQVVVSSRALHHFAPESLARVYRAVFDLVTSGGFVFNLDHVGAPGDWEQVLRRVRGRFVGERTRALKPHRQNYPLARADQHAGWAVEAGFADADVPWRTFYTALIAGRRPA
jgi:trans-aconitate methyltransferase